MLTFTLLSCHKDSHHSLLDAQVDDPRESALPAFCAARGGEEQKFSGDDDHQSTINGDRTRTVKLSQNLVLAFQTLQ